MLQKYRDRIKRLPPDARQAIVEELELDISPRARNFVELLESCHIASADVVVALLRRPACRAQAEAVAGVKIQRGPVATPPAKPAPVTRPASGGDDRKVTWQRLPSPARPGSKFAAHYAIVKVGMTVAQLLGRGVQRSDVREWLKREWIRLEDGE